MEELVHIFSLSGRGLRLEYREETLSAIETLVNSQNVQVVRLNGNTFGVEACKVIGEVLSTKSTLQVADLSDIFTGRSSKEIPLALESLLTGLLSCKQCHTIYLNDNAFGPTAASPLIYFLSHHLPLKHLYLSNNGLGPQAGMGVAQALEALATLQREQTSTVYLKTISCGRNRLESSSMRAWSKCFQAHTALTELRMPQNGIRSDGISILLETGLSACTLLQVLDLQDNTFTVVGAKVLAATLPKWPCLIELGISDCLLSKAGGKMLARALALGNHKQLSILKLQYNEIDEDGVAMLATAIEKTLPNLEVLELNGNAFSEEDDAIEKIKSIFQERGKGILDALDDMEELSELDSLDESHQESSKDSDEETKKQTDVSIKKEENTNLSFLLNKTHIM